jgi:hypothetical protein
MMYEGPKKAVYSVEVNDWRLEEVRQMEPQSVMAELLSLSEALHDARFAVMEASREVRTAEEYLEGQENAILQAALDSEDDDISSQVEGKNAEERKRRAGLFLASCSGVMQAREEVREAQEVLEEAEIELDTFMDRQKNLHSWARMFERQCQLLSSVYVPKPWEVPSQELAVDSDEAFAEMLLGQLGKMIVEEALEESGEAELTPEAQARILANIEAAIEQGQAEARLAQAAPDATKAVPEVGLEEGKLEDAVTASALAPGVQEAIDRHTIEPPTFADDNEPVKTAL